MEPVGPRYSKARSWKASQVLACPTWKHDIISKGPIFNAHVVHIWSTPNHQLLKKNIRKGITIFQIGQCQLENHFGGVLGKNMAIFRKGTYNIHWYPIWTRLSTATFPNQTGHPSIQRQPWLHPHQPGGDVKNLTSCDSIQPHPGEGTK